MIDLVKRMDTHSQGLEEKKCEMDARKTEKKRQREQVGRCDQEIWSLNVVTGAVLGSH